MGDGKLKKIINHPWVVGVGGGLIVVTITTVIFKKRINWSVLVPVPGAIGKALVFKIGVPAWALLIITTLFITVAVKAVYQGRSLKVVDRGIKEAAVPDYLEYTKDTIKGLLRRWNYSENYEGTYVVKNVWTYCPKCNCVLSTYLDRGQSFFGCPDCDFKSMNKLDEDDLIAIINRNIVSKYSSET